MNPAIRKLVRERASNRCEYCRIRQENLPLVPFHVEHIIPKQHDGTDESSNLAPACLHCNLHKGPNLSGIDPDTEEIVTLFHPRKEHWEEHFAFQDVIIAGLTPIGRATVRVLNMNTVRRLELRSELKEAGELL